MKLAIGIVIGVVIVAASGAVLVWKVRAALNAAPSATTVRTDPVTPGEVVEVVSAPGKVEPKTRVQISARVAARIVEIPFEEGAAVTRGDPSANPPKPASLLVKLDSADLEAQLKGAQAHHAAQGAQIRASEARVAAQEAQIAASRVMLADAERDLERQKRLLATRDVGKAVVDTAQAKVDQSDAQLRAALRSLEADRLGLEVMRHQLDAAAADITRARDSLSYTTITSPIDGTVTRVNAKAGELAMTGTMNNPGTVILEVADLSQMLVNTRVDESVVPQVGRGQKAKVRIQAYPDEVFDGVVHSVALATTDERDGSKYYKTDVLLKTEGRRLPTGLTAEVEIETRRHNDVLKVPSQAVLGRPTDALPMEIRDRPEVDKGKTFVTVVYRLIDGKAVVTPVRIGASDVTHTVVKSGLSEGELVITGPYKVLESLAHDQKVKEDKPATRPATQPATQAASAPAR